MKITRIKELKKSLESFNDDDFIFFFESQYGTTLWLSTEMNKNNESTMKLLDIITVPMTTKSIQDYIKDKEHQK